VAVIHYNEDDSFIFILPRTWAHPSQPHGLAAENLEKMCKRQLEQQGLWLKYLPRFDKLNEDEPDTHIDCD
jgi:hypothetical protein